MKIFILLVENGKVCLLWKVVEQVQQGQTGYADALLEYVDATLLIEVKLSVDGLQKGNHVPIVVPDEKVSQDGLFRWKSGVVEPLQSVHVLVRELTFRHLASVRFQILVVVEPGGYVVGHV